MMPATAHERDHSAPLVYETPPPVRAAERHGPFHLERNERAIRITAVYRTAWGRGRGALRVAAGLGLAFLLVGGVIDAVTGRTVLIDVRRWPPLLAGSAASLIGFALLALSLVGWIALRALSWRRLQRLEVDAGPDELLIRLTPPAGEQAAGRWKPQDIGLVVAEPYVLSVRPRAAEPMTFAVGGPWTASFWLVERIGEATGIRTAMAGREHTD